jgi:hypothetical protein
MTRFLLAKFLFKWNNNKYITVYDASHLHKTIQIFTYVSNAFSELKHVSVGCGDLQELKFT